MSLPQISYCHLLTLRFIFFVHLPFIFSNLGSGIPCLPVWTECFKFSLKKRLAPDMRQCPAKNRDISDKCYFITSTVVRREVKKNYRRLKTQKHLLNMGLYRFFMKISINNLLMQFFHIMNCTMWLNKMILYQYLVVAFLLRTSSPMKTLYVLLNSNT